MKTYQNYINGVWESGTDTFNNINPSDDSLFAQQANGTASDAERAVKAAHEAQKSWAAMPAYQRAKLVHKVGDIIQSRIPEIVNLLMEETGAWIGISKFQAGHNPDFWYAGAALAYQVSGEVIPSDHGKTSMVIREPLGVVSVITPWNVPLLLGARTVAGILAIGNTVVLKPSELSPITGGVIIAEACEAAGIPPGVINMVACSRANVQEVGSVLVEDPRVKAVSFTGSPVVGKQIGAKCGALLKKASLELGGKDALVILEDADINKAVEGATFGSFMHQGQICMATKRIFVPSALEQEFTERYYCQCKQTLGTGDVKAMNKPIGPLINRQQVDKLLHQVEDAKAKGATVLTGGNATGNFMEATVLKGVTKDMATYREESFGPLTAIYSYDNLEDALAIVNDIPLGLSSSVHSKDEEKAFQVAKRINSGMAHINCNTINDDPHAPFGGEGDSGLGRYGGKATIQMFTKTRWMTIEKGRATFSSAF